MGNKLNSEDIGQVKTFMQAMDWFNLTSDEKEKFLSDKRLSQTEKKILSASFLLRKGEYAKIIEMLSHLNSSHCLVQAMGYFVLGVTYNAQANHDLGIRNLNEAKEIFEQTQVKHWEFQCLVQIFYCYLNLKMKQELAIVMDELELIDELSDKDQYSLFRCRFNYFSFIGNYSKAKLELNRIEKVKQNMHPSQYINFLVDKFIFHLKIDRLDLCENDLKTMQKFRDYRLTESFYFMQSLFEHYQFRKPIYLYDVMFKEKPLLFHQLKVIQALESGEQATAQLHWQELHQLNSEVYKGYMNYQGDKCLFSLCLSLYSQMGNRDISLLMNLNLNTSEKALITYLNQAGKPVLKEELYEVIWGEKLNDKNGLSRLATLVSRLKSKTGIEIISRKGSYSLKMTTFKKKKIS